MLLSLFAISANALDVQSWKTPEGAKVLFVETKGLPILDIRLNFDAASSRDGDKPGLALMTNNLIGTATKNKDEEQIIQDFESIGANLSVNSLKDMSMVSLRTLTRLRYCERRFTILKKWSPSQFLSINILLEIRGKHIRHLRQINSHQVRLPIKNLID